MTDSDSARPPRPRQVTLGAGMALVSCVLLVFNMLDSMPRMRSIEMRETVREALTTSPGSGLGIEVDTVLGLLRVAVLVTGGLAAAGAVLAIFCLQRHHGARIGLGVTALLLLLTGTFVSGLLPLVVALGAAMLWGREARDWFAGHAPRPDPHAVSASVSAPARPPVPAAPAAQAAPAAPAAQASPAPYAWPGPAAAPDVRSSRPVPVTVAACLTWAFSALTMLFLFLVLLLLLADPGQLLRALQDNPQIAAAGYTDRDLLGLMWVIVSVGLFWCLAAVALAVLAFRRVNLGRIGLALSAVLTGVFGAITLVGLLHAMAALATIVLLFSRGAGQWYAGKEPPHLPPPEPPRPPSASGRPPVW
jgi:hypothetical protein